MKTPDGSGFFAVLVCSLSLVARPACALDGTWTNPNGGSWTNAANWNEGSIAGSSGGSQSATVTLSLRPTLEAHRSAGYLQLSWPAGPATALERATTFSPPADWAPATNAVSTAGSRRVVLMDTTTGTAFYRLRQ